MNSYPPLADRLNRQPPANADVRVRRRPRQGDQGKDGCIGLQAGSFVSVTPPAVIVCSA